MSDEQQPKISLTYRTLDEASQHWDTFVKFLGHLTRPSLSIDSGVVTIGASLDEFVASYQSLSEALGGITSISAGKKNWLMSDFYLRALPDGGAQEFLARLHKFQEQFGGTFEGFSLSGNEEEINLNGIDVQNIVGRRNRFMEIWGNTDCFLGGDNDDADLELWGQSCDRDSVGLFFEPIQEFLGEIPEAQVCFLQYGRKFHLGVGFKGISAAQLSANHSALHAFERIWSLDLK
jgi:hypothetical protein